MDDKKNIIAAVGYITWIGFIIAIVMGDMNDKFARHHLNQALVINIASIVGGVLAVIPLVGKLATGIASMVVFIYCVLGAISAYKGSMSDLPFIGDIKIIK